MGIITKGLSMGRAYLENQAAKKASKKMRGGGMVKKGMVKKTGVKKFRTGGEIKGKKA